MNPFEDNNMSDPLMKGLGHWSEWLIVGCQGNDTLDGEEMDIKQRHLAEIE